MRVPFFTLLYVIRYVTPQITYFIEDDADIFDKGRSEMIRFQLNTTVNHRRPLITALDKILKIKSGGSSDTNDDTIKLQRLLVLCRDIAGDVKTNLDVISSLKPTKLGMDNNDRDICTYTASPFLTAPKSLQLNIDKQLRGYESLGIKKKIAAVQALIDVIQPFSLLVKHYVTLIVALVQGRVSEEIILLTKSLQCRHFQQFKIEAIDCSLFDSQINCELLLDEKILMDNIKRFIPIPYRNITVGKEFYSDYMNIFVGGCDASEEVCDFTSIVTDECAKWKLQVLNKNIYPIYSPCEKFIDERLFLYIGNIPVILQNAELIFENGSSFVIQPPSMVKASQTCKINFDNGESLTLFPTDDNFAIIESNLSVEERNLFVLQPFQVTEFLIEYLDSITVVFLIISYLSYVLYSYGKTGCNKRKFKRNDSNKVESKALVALLNANSP